MLSNGLTFREKDLHREEYLRSTTMPMTVALLLYLLLNVPRRRIFVQTITVVLACHHQLVGFRHALMFASALVLLIFREARVTSSLCEARRNLALGARGDIALTLEVLAL
jgi:hypothetical protein